MKNNDYPLSIMMGKLENVSTSNAEDYCRSLIVKYFPNPNDSLFFVKKRGDSTFFEIQEGGNNKAFLPSVIDLLEQGVSEIVVPSATRYLLVKTKEESTDFQILPESKRPQSTQELKRSGSMTPFQSDSKNFLFVGISAFIMGITVLITSYGVYLNADRVVFEPRSNQLDGFYRNIMEVENLKEQLPNTYVKKLSFDGGRWIKETGNILSDNGIEVKSDESLDEVGEDLENSDAGSVEQNVEDTEISDVENEDSERELMPKPVVNNDKKELPLPKGVKPVVDNRGDDNVEE